MKIHSSHYEEELGWKNVNKELPEPNKRVKIAHIRIVDWNLEDMEWESEGWWKHDKLWSIGGKPILDGKLATKKDMFKFLEQNPVTHWKNL